MFKRILATLGTMLAVMMAVGIASAVVPPKTDAGSIPAVATVAGGVETTVYEVGDAGTATVVSDGASLSLTTADPADGWVGEIEAATGREVEADFRDGSRRIQFKAELEDGQVKARVRESADDSRSGSDGSTTSTNTGPTPSTTSTTSANVEDDSSDGSGTRSNHDEADDNSGPSNHDEADDNSGPSNHDEADDNSGPSNHDEADDSRNRGDDDEADDNSGPSNHDEADDSRNRGDDDQADDSGGHGGDSDHGGHGGTGGDDDNSNG